MTELATLIRDFGLPTVLAAALIYLVLHGQFQFRYPRMGPKRARKDPQRRWSASTNDARRARTAHICAPSSPSEPRGITRNGTSGARGARPRARQPQA